MVPRYAVLFKVHFWDDFARRQLDRLASVVRHGDIYLGIDETHGAVGEIAHPRQLRMTEQDAFACGLARNVHGNVFWYNSDYPLLLLQRAHPDYAYYVMLEYDVVINCDLDALVVRMAAERVDFIAQPINSRFADWPWAYTCDGVYPRGSTLRHWLNCLALFSGRAIALLWQRRLSVSQRFAAREFAELPYSEAFIASEIDHAGYRLRPLSDYGPTDSYDWWPPQLEGELSSQTGQMFLHPVLDERRFVASMLRWTADPSSVFEPTSLLHRKLLVCQPENYAAAMLTAFAEKPDRVGYRRWQQIFMASDDPSQAGLVNLARRKPATQSSLSPWSRARALDKDAAGANNGRITGNYGFHTAADAKPWWMVDLCGCYAVSEIRVFNSLDHRERARRLSILISVDGRDWTTVWRNDREFGGADGAPLIVRPTEPGVGRFVRLELPEPGLLHLDEVQVFGEPAAWLG